MNFTLRILLSLLAFGTPLSAQLVIVQNVDLRSFPLLTATVFAFDTALQSTALHPSKDRLVFDNLTRQTLGVISCTPPTTPTPISATLVFDGTSQRHLRSFIEGTNAWLRNVDTASQTALVEFGARPYLVRDLNSSDDTIRQSASSLITTSGTDLNRALSDSLCGGLTVAARGIYRRVVVVLTNGHSQVNYQQIDSLARTQAISLYVVYIGCKGEESLRKAAENSGGLMMENVADDQIVSSMSAISKICSGAGACRIQWNTDSTLCQRYRVVRFESRSLGAAAVYGYTLPDTIYRHLVVDLFESDLGPVPDGAHMDTTITVTALGTTISLVDIVSNNPQFEIIGRRSGVSIARNVSYSFIVRFNSTDEYRRFARISVLSDACDTLDFYVSANRNFNPAISPLLENFQGAENIYAGSLNTLKWSGVLPSDTVTIELSIDGGDHWQVVSNEATGLQMPWRAPDTVSKRCYFRISSLNQVVYHYSDSAFTIMRPSVPLKSVDCGTQRVGDQKEILAVSTVCNNTNTLLRIDSVLTFNPSFEPVSGYPASVALSSCADLEIRFQPRSTALERDTLSVYTSAGLLRVPVSGKGIESAARIQDYINIGRIPIGVLFDSVANDVLCRAASSIVRVTSITRSFPDTAHYNLPTQPTTAVLTPEDPCKSLRVQFNCTQIARFCSRVFFETDAGRYETVVFGEGICAPPEPHYGIEVPDSLMIAIGGKLDVPIQYYPAPFAYRQMKRPWVITVRFNKSILFPIGNTPLGVEEGEDRVLTLYGKGFEKGDTLILLHFAGAFGSVDHTLMRLESFNWRDECLFNPAVASGRVFVTNVCRAGGLREYVLGDSLRFSLVQPNPARDQTELHFSLRENGITELHIVDVFGREVDHVFEQFLERGAYTATVDLTKLCAGDYYAVLRTPTGRISTPIGVLR